jgi:hypothetical protein
MGTRLVERLDPAGRREDLDAAAPLAGAGASVVAGSGSFGSQGAAGACSVRRGAGGSGRM